MWSRLLSIAEPAQTTPDRGGGGRWGGSLKGVKWPRLRGEKVLLVVKGHIWRCNGSVTPERGHRDIEMRDELAGEGE